MKIATKKFNVSVIGLSGMDVSGEEYKVGKSFFCNRFVRPAHDELVLNHDSVYNQEYLNGRVINRDTFLYWGCGKIKTANQDLVDISLIEFTSLRRDINANTLIPEYLETAIVSKLYSKQKLAYFSPAQIKAISKFPQERMSDLDEFSIDGFIICYNVDPTFQFIEAQDYFLANALKKIEKLKKPVAIVATKCDKIINRTDISSHIIEKMSKKENFNLTAPIIETSAVYNVNIAFAFQSLYSLIDTKNKNFKAMNFQDAYNITEVQNGKLIEEFSNMIIESTDPLSRFSLMTLYKKNNNFDKIIKLIEIIGIEGARDVYTESKKQKILKLKDRMLQYCLSKFETCISSVFKNYLDIEALKEFPIDFIDYFKAKNIFNDWFEECELDVNSLDFIEQYMHNISDKIPTKILTHERFKVLVDKHRARLYSISNQKTLKRRLENIFEESIQNKNFTIKSSINDMIQLLINKKETELAESLNEAFFNDIYNLYYQKLLLKAKNQLHELIFENTSRVLSIRYENKSQLVKEYSNVIGKDPRFQIFDGPLEQLRKNWIFAHYTFSTSNAFCLLSPLSPCSENQAKNVISSVFDYREIKFDSQLDDQDDLMILFVIACDNLYMDFEKEFLKIVDSSMTYTFYIVNVNGYSRKILPIKIDSIYVDWNNILTKYADHKLSFIGIYSDASTFKFVEKNLSDLHVFFQKIWRNKTTTSFMDSFASIEKIQASSISINSIYNMSNIVILFCLRPHIIEEYRTFWSRLNDSTFFQESMLGRLVEQGRNISTKYSAKLIQPYLDEIIDKSLISPFHELQVIDSIKYLEETIFGRPDSLIDQCDSIHNIKILMCCMCGDNYPLEMIIGMLLFGRKYEYSNRKETVFFEYKSNEDIYIVSLKIVSFHSAFVLINKEKYHGCISVYSMMREASFCVMKAFSSQTHIPVFQIIGILGVSSHSRLYVQKTLRLKDFISATKVSIESVDQNENYDNIAKASHFNYFLKECLKELNKEIKLSKEKSLSSSGNEQVGVNYSRRFGNFQFKRDKKDTKNETKKLNYIASADPVEKARILWSENPAFGSSPEQNVRTEMEQPKVSSFIDMGYILIFMVRKISRKNTIKFKILKTKIFDSRRSLRVKSSQNKNLQKDERISTGMPSSPSTPNNSSLKNKLLFPMRFVGVKSSKKNEADLNHAQKMLEWESRSSKKTQQAEYKYFGKPLDQIKLICNVPLFVIKTIIFIEDSSLEVEGLYRRSGSKQDVETLKLTFESDFDIDFNNLGFNVHVFTGALKTFFSTLPSSFIPVSFIPKILEATSQTDPNVRIDQIKSVVETLPNPILTIFTFLMHHLARVYNCKEKNKMDARNLAICFWPSLIKNTMAVDIRAASLGDNLILCLFIHTIIENAFEILGECPKISSNEYSALDVEKKNKEETITAKISTDQ
ncbi:hypothetical protein HZS_3850, partial [Henneguya salminicola]